MSAESVAASRCERHPPPDRDYQAAGIKQAYATLKRMVHPRRRLLLVAATGAGKTHIACRMAYDCYRHRRVLFIVDRDKLVDQTLASFRTSLPCWVAAIKAGHPENRAAQVQVASRQTMQSRGWWRAWIREAPAVIFVDEAHETAFSKVVRDELTAPHPHQVWCGLTATPWRLSTREGLGDLFDEMVQLPPPSALMEEGQLLWPRYVIAEDALDFSSARKVGGDYALNDQARIANTDRAIRSLYANWTRWVDGQRNVIFCVDKAHAAAVHTHWQAHGQPSSIITEESDTNDRRRSYAGLKSGSIPTLINVNVATKGFDETKIRWVVLARATKSVALLHQMIGRGGRTDRPCHHCGAEVPVSPVPTCRRCKSVQPPEHVATWPTWFGVLDQTRTLLDPGICLPEQIVRYELTRGSGGAPGRPPTKVCPACGHIVHLAAPVCPPDRGGCGYVFPTRSTRQEAVGSAVERSATEIARRAYSQLARANWAAGYDPGATDHRWKARRKVVATDELRLHAIFPRATDAARALFLRHLEVVGAKKAIDKRKKGETFDVDAWVQLWMRREFGE